MAVKSITLADFLNYNLEWHPFMENQQDHSYWLADDEANLIGSVLFHDRDQWGYVILSLEEDNIYRGNVGMAFIETEQKAIYSLNEKMQEIATKGRIEKKIYNSNVFDTKSTIVIKDMDHEIKRFFKKYPNRLYEMHPRRFEELIASIISDLGYHVTLTNASRDGGRDIIASINNTVTNFLAYVECKRYARDHKIGVGIIREIAGVHHIRKPSKSIIVTTSFFTKNALEDAKNIENQLELKDFNDIQAWLEKY